MTLATSICIGRESSHFVEDIFFVTERSHSNDSLSTGHKRRHLVVAWKFSSQGPLAEEELKLFA